MKEYTFSTCEMVYTGDKYVYKVTAKSRKEAFKMLVQWFFGKNKNIDGIKQEHYNVTRPNEYSFIVTGMPHWFGRRIGGFVKEKIYDLWGKPKDINYNDLLREYAAENNIELEKRI